MSDTPAHTADSEPLKVSTARMLKWNLIGRVATQLLYAVTGIILARLLSPVDFGLVGAMLVFQAFASMFIDSGFSSALMQRKSPDDTDYSTVLWFNIGVAVIIYIILYICAPWIAGLFGDERIVAMSRVMFLSFILSAASIVHANRLTKQLNVRPVTIADIIALAAGGAVGIWLAFASAGAWAVVWQTVTYNGVRSVLLWCAARWRPSPVFSPAALRSFMRLGMSVLATSFLNVLFQNIYSFFVGNRAGLSSLGYYTQGDKWSKMGVMSVSQSMTSSFLPVLSGVQDEPDRYTRISAKINRFALYITLPVLCGLATVAPALFHTLFGAKWDAAVVLFQLLCVRGVFTVMTLQYNNFALSLGRASAIVRLEMLRDGVALAALIPMLPYLALTRGTDITYGLRLMIYGQLAASALTWLVTLIYTARVTRRPAPAMLADSLPYLAGTLLCCCAAAAVALIPVNAALTLAIQIICGGAVYLIFNAVCGSKIQHEVLSMIFRRRSHNITH